MKKFRKLASLLVSVVMVLAMCIPAFAEKVDVSGHTFEAYKLFKAESADTDGKLNGLDWADGVAEAAKTALLAKASPAAKNVGELAKYLSNATDDQVADFREAVLDNKSSLGDAISVTNGSTKLELGYYVIFDTSDATKVDAVNKAVLYVVTDATKEVTIQSKVEVPTSHKKVKDANDTDGTQTEWLDTADYDIGDSVPFQLTATLPGNYSDYKDYHFTFHDTASTGLTVPTEASAFTVKMNDTPLTIDTNYSVNLAPTDKHSFDITFSAAQLAAAKATNGATIIVEYSAVLNDSANVGKAGNPNTSWITFKETLNNNPSAHLIP